MADQIINHNKTFVGQRGSERNITDKHPDKKLAVLSMEHTRMNLWMAAAILALCAQAALLSACKNKSSELPSTLKAPLRIADDGSVSIDDVEQVLLPFEGTYLDEDNHEPNLHISYRRSDGLYDVQIGIFRLTDLDDGLGRMGDDGLQFTATDAAGNPIGGIITLNGDTATVTFTDSTWPLLENGSQFVYTRELR